MTLCLRDLTIHNHDILQKVTAIDILVLRIIYIYVFILFILFQSVILDKITMEVFTASLQEALGSQVQPNLLPFLQQNLPPFAMAIRQSQNFFKLLYGEVEVKSLNLLLLLASVPAPVF